MSEVSFYHLTRGSAEAALPALLGRTLAASARALVLCGTAERVAALDTALWLSRNPDWLPHGTETGGDADLQPIWLTTQVPASASDIPNGATYLFLLDGTEAPLELFTRCFDLFDGNDPEQVAAARRRWVAARAGGHRMAYWKQGERGWEKEA